MAAESTRVADNGRSGTEYCGSEHWRTREPTWSTCWIVNVRSTADGNACGRLRERALSVTTLAAGEFHAPSLADFFPPAVLFEGTPFEMDRLMIIRVAWQ